MRKVVRFVQDYWPGLLVGAGAVVLGAGVWFLGHTWGQWVLVRDFVLPIRAQAEAQAVARRRQEAPSANIQPGSSQVTPSPGPVPSSATGQGSPSPAAR